MRAVARHDFSKLFFFFLYILGLMLLVYTYYYRTTMIEFELDMPFCYFKKRDQFFCFLGLL